jgi:hypothetical protein
VCFDSFEAASYLLSIYNSNVLDTMKIMCGTITDKVKDCVGKTNEAGDQNRDTSFSMFEDEEDQSGHNIFHKDITLIMDPAKEPVDICWFNMGGTYGLYYWRRLFLLLISLVVVIFFSTPSSILAAMKRVDILNITETSEGFVKHYIPIVGNSIITYFPPLMVILVN